MDTLLQGNTPPQKFVNPSKPTYKECLNYFEDYLRKIPFFKEAAFDDLDEYWEYLQLVKNKPICMPGDICRHIVFIVKGAVKHFTEDKNGRYIITFATDGYFCTAIPSFLHEVEAKDGLVCVKNTYGLKISLENFKKLSAKRPEFEDLFRAIQDEEMRRLINRLKSFQSSDAKGRYEMLMRQNSSVFNHFTMQDISNYLGIKPETLSRLRNEKTNI